jgi:hypothetical protein
MVLGQYSSLRSERFEQVGDIREAGCVKAIRFAHVDPGGAGSIAIPESCFSSSVTN